MTDNNEKDNIVSVGGETKTQEIKQNTTKNTSSGNFVNRNSKREGGSDRKPRAIFERPKPEFDQKMISIRRVTRVVAGGRRMTFAVALAIGDKKGSVGLGTGKGGDTAIAITKALRQAKKNMFKIKTNKENSIPHETSAKFSSSKLTIFPNHGKGLVAGSTVRDILFLAGLKNITAKLNSGSKNKLNNARVACLALSKFQNKQAIIKEISVPAENLLDDKEIL